MNWFFYDQSGFWIEPQFNLRNVTSRLRQQFVHICVRTYSIRILVCTNRNRWRDEVVYIHTQAESGEPAKLDSA